MKEHILCEELDFTPTKTSTLDYFSPAYINLLDTGVSLVMGSRGSPADLLL